MLKNVRTDKNKPERKQFIGVFFNAVVAASRGLNGLFARESIHAKMLRAGGHDPKKILRGFHNLRHRNLIHYSGNSHFRFTARGKRWATKQAIHRPLLRQKRWDHKWRIVLFDIPENLHKERNTLRRKLIHEGFYMIQKSVFAFPYPCEQFIGDICDQLRLSQYIDVIVADSIGSKEEFVKRHFSL